MFCLFSQPFLGATVGGRCGAVLAIPPLPRRQRSPANSNTRRPPCYISPRISHKQGFIFCVRTALFSAAQHPRSRSGSQPPRTRPVFFFFCLFQANSFLLSQQARGFATWTFGSLQFIWISHYSLKKVQLRGKIWLPLSGLAKR